MADATVHLVRWPRTDRSALSYCPVCLGFGTTRTAKGQPGWHQVDAALIRVGDQVKCEVVYDDGSMTTYTGIVEDNVTRGGGRVVFTDTFHCTDSKAVTWYVQSVKD
jgi:hypothetical protein